LHPSPPPDFFPLFSFCVRHPPPPNSFYLPNGRFLAVQAIRHTGIFPGHFTFFFFFFFFSELSLCRFSRLSFPLCATGLSVAGRADKLFLGQGLPFFFFALVFSFQVRCPPPQVFSFCTLFPTAGHGPPPPFFGFLQFFRKLSYHCSFFLTLNLPFVRFLPGSWEARPTPFQSFDGNTPSSAITPPRPDRPLSAGTPTGLFFSLTFSFLFSLCFFFPLRSETPFSPVPSCYAHFEWRKTFFSIFFPLVLPFPPRLPFFSGLRMIVFFSSPFAVVLKVVMDGKRGSLRSFVPLCILYVLRSSKNF